MEKTKEYYEWLKSKYDKSIRYEKKLQKWEKQKNQRQRTERPKI